MYTEGKIEDLLLEHTKEIAALWEHTKSAHKRVDENDQLTKGIHELAKNIAEMSIEIKLLTERMDRSIERIEEGQKSQGKRITNIEHAITTMERNEKELAKQGQRLDTIEKEPAQKWKTLVAQITGLLVAAIVGVMISKLM